MPSRAVLIPLRHHCLQLLLDEGVDINVANENGETSLHIAAREFQIDAVEVKGLNF